MADSTTHAPSGGVPAHCASARVRRSRGTGSSCRYRAPRPGRVGLAWSGAAAAAGEDTQAPAAFDHTAATPLVDPHPSSGGTLICVYDPRHRSQISPSGTADVYHPPPLGSVIVPRWRALMGSAGAPFRAVPPSTCARPRSAPGRIRVRPCPGWSRPVHRGSRSSARRVVRSWPRRPAPAHGAGHQSPSASEVSGSGPPPPPATWRSCRIRPPRQPGRPPTAGRRSAA